MLLALSAIWGASFMFIKIGVRELHPTTLVFLRLGIGALTLLPLLVVRVGVRESARQMRASAGPLVLTGLVNSAIPIVSISWAEKRIDSGFHLLPQRQSSGPTLLCQCKHPGDQRNRLGRPATHRKTATGIGGDQIDAGSAQIKVLSEI